MLIDAPPTTSASTRTLWWVLALVLLADALDLIDSTVTQIAAPTIAADIGGGRTLMTWLGSAYAVTLGVLLVVGGRLGDRYGQRRLFLVGLAGFTAASAVCGLAADPAMLVAARALQGAFGALLLPQGMAIMTRTFPRDLLRKAFAAFGPLLGLAGVGGPVLAGFVIDADLAGLSWRPVFLVNVVLGVVGLVVGVRMLPRLEGDPAVVVDATAAALLGAAMLGVMVGLIQGPTDGWLGAPLALVIVGTAAFWAFVVRQRTAANPLLSPSLFRNHGFTAGLVIGLAYFAVTSGLTFVLALFLQGALGFTPGATALAMLPLTIGIIAASGATMALIAKLGRTLVVIGVLITLAGAGWLLLLVTTVGPDLSGWQLAPAVFTIGAGMGACFGTIFDITLGDVAPHEAGSASGTLTAVQQLAAGIGSALVSTVYFSAVDGGQVHAVSVALVVVLVVTGACLPLTRLLPRKALVQEHGA